MINMDKILDKIDKKCSEGNKIMAEIAYVSTKSIKQKKDLGDLIRLADRYACLLDFYYETNNSCFYKEAKKQKKALYSTLDKKIKADLNRIEKRILPYFDYEKEIKEKLRKGESFSDKEIKKYILSKSSDAYYSGRLLEMFVPNSTNLVKVFHYRLALSDIYGDLRDFEEDLKHNMPNLLYLHLHNKNHNVPSSRINALIISRNDSVERKIIKFADDLLDKTKRADLTKYPRLEKSIRKIYQKIVRMFK